MAQGDNPLDEIAYAERFQRLFVHPALELVKQEMRNTSANLQTQFAVEREEQRLLREDVDALKANQRKAFVGYGVLAFVLSMLIGFVPDWLKSRMNL